MLLSTPFFQTLQTFRKLDVDTAGVRQQCKSFLMRQLSLIKDWGISLIVDKELQLESPSLS